MSKSRPMILTLVIVAIICAIVLSYVYAFTEPRILETKKNLTLQGLEQAMAAKEFKLIIPDTLWQVYDSSGNFVGIVFRVFPQGYGGPIPITVGINPDGNITGVKIAGPSEGLKETPGLGAKITEIDFAKQFIGKCATSTQIKRDGGEIDAITAATISSRAVCNGIKSGIEKYSSYVNKKDGKTKAFPNATDFIEVVKDSLWYAMNSCDTLGIVFKGSTFGYLNLIQYIVGMDKKGEIIGIEILFSKETEGVGELIRDKKFLGQLKSGNFDTITGATISSGALIKSITANMGRYQRCLK